MRYSLGCYADKNFKGVASRTFDEILTEFFCHNKLHKFKLQWFGMITEAGDFSVVVFLFYKGQLLGLITTVLPPPPISPLGSDF